LPNLASAHEQGLVDFEAPTWFAGFLPRGAPEPIIVQLAHRVLRRRRNSSVAFGAKWTFGAPG
jgi:tripartite-type tricarboxylate transporter receptor subunit TctC